MYQESTIPIKSNQITVYISRQVGGDLDSGGKVQFLLVNRENASDDEWGLIYTDVKPMEMCWQAALNQVRIDTSLVPDRVYSVNEVETYYDVKTHAIMLVPIFVAMFDHEQVTVPMVPDLETMWVDADDVEKHLELTHQKDLISLVKRDFFENEPSANLKVYPTRF